MRPDMVRVLKPYVDLGVIIVVSVNSFKVTSVHQ